VNGHFLWFCSAGNSDGVIHQLMRYFSLFSGISFEEQAINCQRISSGLYKCISNEKALSFTRWTYVHNSSYLVRAHMHGDEIFTWKCVIVGFRAYLRISFIM
jgi:hypothetical protein